MTNPETHDWFRCQTVECSAAPGLCTACLLQGSERHLGRGCRKMCRSVSGSTRAKPCLLDMTGSLHSWAHRTRKAVNIPAWGRRDSWASIPIWGAIDFWQRRIHFFKDMAPVRSTMLHWKVPYSGVYRQNKSESVGYLITTNKQKMPRSCSYREVEWVWKKLRAAVEGKYDKSTLCEIPS